MESARRVYIRRSSARKSEDSEPPTPDFNSIRADNRAAEDGGTSNLGKTVLIWCDKVAVRVLYSSEARERMAGSGSFNKGIVSRRSY
jgi:hypothetical protein